MPGKSASTLTHAMILANAGLAAAYSLPSAPHQRAAAARTEAASCAQQPLENGVGAKMFVEDDTVDNGNQCHVSFEEAPIEDPNFTCWLNPESDLMDDYICVQEHPCLEFSDGYDHSDDSY